MEKRAVVISCSDHYGHRMVHWDAELRELGYGTTYLTTDFLHVEKKTYVCPVEGCVQLHVPPYRKNLSVQRILSHRSFAKQVFAYLEKTRPQAVVSLIPPNFLVKYLARYKRRHPETKLIFDIFDLWPETFPSSRAKQLLAPAFRVWANLRDRHLSEGDFVASECDLFRRKLNLPTETSAVLPFALDPYEGEELSLSLPRDRAEIAYLGSINNIIDIPRITALLAALRKRMPVTLHVIGSGEKSEEFCNSVKNVGVDVRFYGPVYDEGEKHRILSGCHFGLNIMKDSVCVGLTMKSVDYFRHGLPLINSIPADTEELIRSLGVGVHLSDPDSAAEAIAAAVGQGTEPMRRAVGELFSTRFTSSAIRRQCREILKQIL